jgi:hypothetical protein
MRTKKRVNEQLGRKKAEKRMESESSIGLVLLYRVKKDQKKIGDYRVLFGKKTSF